VGERQEQTDHINPRSPTSSSGYEVLQKYVAMDLCVLGVIMLCNNGVDAMFPTTGFGLADAMQCLLLLLNGRCLQLKEQ